MTKTPNHDACYKDTEERQAHPREDVHIRPSRGGNRDVVLVRRPVHFQLFRRNRWWYVRMDLIPQHLRVSGNDFL